MTTTQAAQALAPRVVCVMAPANQPATKRVRRSICNHEMVLAVEVDVRSLGPCLECMGVRR